MKRRGLINWKTKLNPSQQAAQNAGAGAGHTSTMSLLASSTDPTANSNSALTTVGAAASPQRNQRVSQHHTSQQRSAGGNRDAHGEFLAALTIHERQSNVMLQDGAGEDLVFLGDNEKYQPGDVVEVVPIVSALGGHKDHSSDTRVAKRAANLEASSVDRNAPVFLIRESAHKLSPVVKKTGRKAMQETNAVLGSSTDSKDRHPRASLVVRLNKGFYKPNQQTKKLFVSIEQNLAELHGFRKDMTVKVRKIEQDDLRRFADKFSTGSQAVVPPSTYPFPQAMRDGANSQSQLIQMQLQQRFEELVADRVEVTVRDQFASRRDMWHLVQSLNNKTIYKGHQVDLESVRFKIRNIFTAKSDKSGNDPITSASRAPFNSLMLNYGPKFVHKRALLHGKSSGTAHTKEEGAYIEQNSAIVSTRYTRFSFFTKSCQVYCLVEVSKELYDFDSTGYTNMEKLQLFVRSYLERCKGDYSTHEIVFILYARLYYPQASTMAELLMEARKQTGRHKMTEKDLEKEGVYQQSKNKIFQDVYLKAGVVNLTLDTTKTDYERFLTQLGQHIQRFPQLVNWQLKCPSNFRPSQPAHPDDRFDDISTQIRNLNKKEKQRSSTQQSFQLPCELGESERTNILEVMNLALFNLNNEEVDINLRTTGTQMLILTAGMATYRVNEEIIQPTKSRVLLGGVQVSLISFAKEPPYQTPLLIACCKYTNPFERKKCVHGAKQAGDRRTHAANLGSPGRRLFAHSVLDVNNSLESHLIKTIHQGHHNPFGAGASSSSKPCENYRESKPIDWVNVTFLPHIKLLETHLSCAQRKKSSALLSLSKTPLLVPLFQQFQQARLRESVFGGLLWRDKRLFEPHSMFARSYEQLRAVEQQAKARQQRVEQGAAFSAQRQGRASQNRLRKKKFWRIDPDMYQLRKPNLESEQYLLLDRRDDEETISFTIDKQRAGGRGGAIESQWSDCESPLESSPQHSIAMRIQTSPNSPAGMDDTSTVGAGNNSKLKLRQQLAAYDAHRQGPADDEQEVRSAQTSMHSSPVKSPYSSKFQRDASPRRIKKQFSKNSTLDGKQGDNNVFSTNILQPKHSFRHGQKSHQQTTGRLGSNLMATSTQFITNTLGYSKASTRQESLQQKMPPKPFRESNYNQSHAGYKKQIADMQAMQIQKKWKKDTPPVPSFDRRWSHAVSIFQLGLHGASERGSSGPRPYSMSFDQLPEVGGFSTCENPFELALTGNYFDPLCKLMDSFWRQLTEVALMPLTSLSYPAEFPRQSAKDTRGQLGSISELKDTEDNASCYDCDIHFLKGLDVEENLCLRLTQNFQFINERGSCDFKKEDVSYEQYHYKMAFRDIYSEAKKKGPNAFETLTNWKFKIDNISIQETVAAFRYLLYNHHTRQLEPKTSQESRLFEISKVKNLDVVQQALSEATEHCIKLPQLRFVIFYDREEARKLRPQDKAPLTEIEEELQEEEKFRELVKGLVKNLGLSSLSWIKVIRQSQIATRIRLKNTYEDIETAQEVPYDLSSSADEKSQVQATPRDLSPSATPEGQSARWEPTIMQSFVQAGHKQHPNTKQSSRTSSIDAETMLMNQTQNLNSRDTVGSQMQFNANQLQVGAGTFIRGVSGSIRASRPPGGAEDKKRFSFTQVYSLDGSGQKARSRSCVNQYLLEHDRSYTTGACFHLKLSWLFSRGPTIQARVIKRFQRQVKDLSSGCFKTFPLSEIVRQLQLNPFESETTLRENFTLKAREEMLVRKREEAERYERQSFTAGGDFSICFEEVLDESNFDEYDYVGELQSRFYRAPIFTQTNIIKKEKLFQSVFPSCLTKYCGFILDSKSTESDCAYYLEKESGLSYVRHNEATNEISYNENDIVNNGNTDQSPSLCSRAKVQTAIVVSDILIDLLFDMLSTKL